VVPPESRQEIAVIEKHNRHHDSRERRRHPNAARCRLSTGSGDEVPSMV
jgi:hypothetical protein